MSLTSPGSAPPGWYPDPGGQRQWRVWTGTLWSEMTRPYGEPIEPTSLVGSLPLINALHRLVRYGIVATFGGLGLVVSVLAHWPGTSQPTAALVAATLCDTGAALVIIGSVCYAFAVRALEGRWTAVAFVPGLNMLAASGLVTSRIGGRSALRRVVAEAVLLGLFIAQSHAHPWLGVAPALVALDHARWTQALVERLTGRAIPQPAAP